MKNFTKKIALVAIAFLAFSCSSPDAEKSLKSVSIAEITKASPEYSSFTEALEITGLTSTFENEGNYTVFVPNDTAFASLLSTLGYATLQDLEDAQPGLLATVLKYHVVADAGVLSTDLTDNQSVTTLSGASFTVHVNTTDDILSITDGSAATSDATITARDIKCSNGIIHTVDTVLLPPSE